jgi:putative glycosyltransferase (TIGR04348 family)
MSRKPPLVIVTPALADARNGNWQTAKRWAKMLSTQFSPRLCRVWDGDLNEAPAALMIALHARRSADSIGAWAATGRPLVVALTGTDLYRDITEDADAQRSLALADRLIVLQERGPLALPAEYRAKAVVCFQSTPDRRPQPKTDRHLRLLAVGHLRQEKSPATYFDLARQLAGDPGIFLDHIGGVLEPALGEAAAALAASLPRYRWLGSLPHEAVRRRIGRAHLLIHPSRMEGGAHVIMEALRSGTAVLASRVDGNVGMLGDDYAGYFSFGDVDELATLVRRCRDDPAFMARLLAQGARRAPLFSPEREQATLLQLISQLIGKP